jgi:DeoR/GlpR family transcriptional regulator of sugar metabolism
VDLIDVKMKQSRLGIAMRREKIIRILEAKGFVLASELSSLLKVTLPTIQRDLDAMQKNGKIGRWGEGAFLFVDETKDSLIYKHAIAMEAARHVNRGDTIFINSSYTALLMLPYITASQVTVVTNNPKAIDFKRRDDTTLILAGGQVCSPENILFGELTLNSMKDIDASKSFLGCNGITVQKGITSTLQQEAAINDLMLGKTSGERFILADRTKVGRTSFYMCGTCERFSCLITDSTASNSEVKRLSRHMEVIQVTIPAQRNLKSGSLMSH